MSEDVATAPAPGPAVLPSNLPFEQQIYTRSPVGLVATTAVVLLVLFGSFLTVASIEHVTTIHRTPNGLAFSDASWPALVLSLLCCAALVLQRYARIAEARDAPAFARILTGGMASAAVITGAAVPRETRLARATLVGLAAGLVFSVLIRLSETREGHLIPPMTLIWYACATTFLNVLFARGFEQTRAGNRSYADTLNSELKIDLLRTDTLAVLGRSAARSALIWFIISAVACLFFVGGDLNWLTIILVVSCAAVGLGLFVSIMSRIHKQIVAVKQTELEHVRCRIEAERATFHTDAVSAANLHGLLAYEKRIADAPEWPFDQPTLVRVGAYILIPTIPWFGQAVVQYFIEHLAHG